MTRASPAALSPSSRSLPLGDAPLALRCCLRVLPALSLLCCNCVSCTYNAISAGARLRTATASLPAATLAVVCAAVSAAVSAANRAAARAAVRAIPAPAAAVDAVATVLPQPPLVAARCVVPAVTPTAAAVAAEPSSMWRDERVRTSVGAASAAFLSKAGGVFVQILSAAVSLFVLQFQLLLCYDLCRTRELLHSLLLPVVAAGSRLNKTTFLSKKCVWAAVHLALLLSLLPAAAAAGTTTHDSSHYPCCGRPLICVPALPSLLRTASVSSFSLSSSSPSSRLSYGADVLAVAAPPGSSTALAAIASPPFSRWALLPASPATEAAADRIAPPSIPVPAPGAHISRVAASRAGGAAPVIFDPAAPPSHAASRSAAAAAFSAAAALSPPAAGTAPRWGVTAARPSTATGGAVHDALTHFSAAAAAAAVSCPPDAVAGGLISAAAGGLPSAALRPHGSAAAGPSLSGGADSSSFAPAPLSARRGQASAPAAFSGAAAADSSSSEAVARVPHAARQCGGSRAAFPRSHSGTAEPRARCFRRDFFDPSSAAAAKRPSRTERTAARAVAVAPSTASAETTPARLLAAGDLRRTFLSPVGDAVRIPSRRDKFLQTLVAWSVVSWNAEEQRLRDNVRCCCAGSPLSSFSAGVSAGQGSRFRGVKRSIPKCPAAAARLAGTAAPLPAAVPLVAAAAAVNANPGGWPCRGIARCSGFFGLLCRPLFHEKWRQSAAGVSSCGREGSSSWLPCSRGDRHAAWTSRSTTSSRSSSGQIRSITSCDAAHSSRAGFFQKHYRRSRAWLVMCCSSRFNVSGGNRGGQRLVCNSWRGGGEEKESWSFTSANSRCQSRLKPRFVRCDSVLLCDSRSRGSNKITCVSRQTCSRASGRRSESRIFRSKDVFFCSRRGYGRSRAEYGSKCFCSRLFQIAFLRRGASSWDAALAGDVCTAWVVARACDLLLMSSDVYPKLSLSGTSLPRHGPGAASRAAVPAATQAASTRVAGGLVVRFAAAAAATAGASPRHAAATSSTGSEGACAGATKSHNSLPATPPFFSRSCDAPLGLAARLRIRSHTCGGPLATPTARGIALWGMRLGQREEEQQLLQHPSKLLHVHGQFDGQLTLQQLRKHQQHTRTPHSSAPLWSAQQPLLLEDGDVEDGGWGEESEEWEESEALQDAEECENSLREGEGGEDEAEWDAEAEDKEELGADIYEELRALERVRDKELLMSWGEWSKAVGRSVDELKSLVRTAYGISTPPPAAAPAPAATSAAAPAATVVPAAIIPAPPAPTAAGVCAAAAPRGWERIAANAAGDAAAAKTETEGTAAGADRVRRTAAGEAALLRKTAETRGAGRPAAAGTAAGAGRAAAHTEGAANHTGAAGGGAPHMATTEGEEVGRPVIDETTHGAPREGRGIQAPRGPQGRDIATETRGYDVPEGRTGSLKAAAAAEGTPKDAQLKQRETSRAEPSINGDDAVESVGDFSDGSTSTSASGGRLHAADVQLPQEKKEQQEQQKHRSGQQQRSRVREENLQHRFQQNWLHHEAEQREGDRGQAMHTSLQEKAGTSRERGAEEKQSNARRHKDKEGREGRRHSHVQTGSRQWSAKTRGEGRHDLPHARKDGHVSFAYRKETSPDDEAKRPPLVPRSRSASVSVAAAVVELRSGTVGVAGSPAAVAQAAALQRAASKGVRTGGGGAAPDAAAVKPSTAALDVAAGENSHPPAAAVGATASSGVAVPSEPREGHQNGRQLHMKAPIRSKRKQQEKLSREVKKLKKKGGDGASAAARRGRSPLASLLLSPDEYRQLLSLSRVEAVRAALEGAPNEEEVLMIPQESAEEDGNVQKSEFEEEFPERLTPRGKQSSSLTTATVQAARARDVLADCRTLGRDAAAAFSRTGVSDGCLLRPPTVEEWAAAVTAGDVKELSRRLDRGRALLETCLRRLQPLAQAAVQRFRAANKLAALVRQQLREQGDYEAVKAYMAKGTEEELELLLVAMQGIRQGLKRHARTALRRSVRLKRERERERMLRLQAQQQRHQQQRHLQQQQAQQRHPQQLQGEVQQQREAQGGPQQQTVQHQQMRRQQDEQQGTAGDLLADCSGVSRSEESTGLDGTAEDHHADDDAAAAAADEVAARTAAAAEEEEEENKDAEPELEPPPSVAYWMWMRTAMAEWEQQKRQVSQFPWRWWSEAARGRKAAHILYQELGREPTQDEVADKIGVAPDRWRDITLATKAAVSTEAEISAAGGVPGLSLGGGAADTGDRRDTVGDFLVSEDLGQEGEQASLHEDLEVQVLDLAAQALDPSEYRMLKKLLAASHGGVQASGAREEAAAGAAAEAGALGKKQPQAVSQSEGDSKADGEESGQALHTEVGDQRETAGLCAAQQRKRQRRQALRGQRRAAKGLGEQQTMEQRTEEEHREGEHHSQQMRETTVEESDETEEADKQQQQQREHKKTEEQRGRRKGSKVREKTEEEEALDAKDEDFCNIRRVLVDFVNDRVNAKLQGAIEKMKEFEVRRILANLSPQEKACGLQNPQALEAVVQRKSAVLQLCLSANTMQGIEQ